MKSKVLLTFVLICVGFSSCEKIANKAACIGVESPFYNLCQNYLCCRYYLCSRRWCNYEDSFEFPYNIPQRMNVDIIQIPDPIMVEADTARYYITSRKYLDSLRDENPDSSLFCLELDTKRGSDDVLCYYEKPRCRFERNKLWRAAIWNNTFEGYFDDAMKVGNYNVFNFRIPPYGFLLSYEPISDSSYDVPSKQMKLVLLPLYTIKQQRAMFRSKEEGEILQQACDWGEWTDVFCLDNPPVDSTTCL